MRLILALLFAASAANAQTRFTETTASGIDSRYTGEWQYMVGGGVATFDCNGDGFEDVYLAGGEGAAGFYRNISTKGGTIEFQKLDNGLDMKGVTGAYPIDIDGDGITDLAILRVGENFLMRGTGNCHFRRANEDWGFDGGDAWSTAFAATWEKGADWPTLAVGNYIDRTQDAFPWGSCTDNWLHRPDGIGFAKPVPLKPSYCALSMLFTDWNNSGQASLRVSNDREYYKGGQEQLWHITPDEPPRLFTPSEGWSKLQIWGMGIAEADLNADGLPEYFLTSMADNKLQSLTKSQDAPVYFDVALAHGVTAQRPYTGGDVRPSTAWHSQFADVNNDGRLDLFIAKGNVAEMPDFAQKDPNNLLIQQADGTFAEQGEAAGVASMETARGASLADFNLDGKLDLLVVNRWNPAQIWQNDTRDAGGFLMLDLTETGANRNAIGAVIEVKTETGLQRNTLVIGGGHASGQLGWRHFGLGRATAAQVRVIWPDGQPDNWQTLAANGFYRLAKGQTATVLGQP